MARFFLLIFVALFVVQYSLAKPSGGRNRHRLHDDDIKKIRKRCKEDPNMCKGQKEEHQKKRHGVKNGILDSLKARGKSHVDAEREAEEQLQKIHELKVKIHEAMGISDIEPADNGLYGGDMVLSTERAQRLIDSLQDEESKSKRAAARFFDGAEWDYKWPSFPIHYWINKTVGWSNDQMALIRDAINTLSFKVSTNCLSFVEDASPAAGNQIQYTSSVPDSGCHSWVGWYDYVPNTINLGRGCMSKGTIMHETIHALGGGHEHQRTDRDKYVTVLWDNVNPNNTGDLSIAWGSTSYGEFYNTKSIMHYESDAFNNAKGKFTIINKATNLPDIGRNEVLTNQDVNQLNKMYCMKEPCKDTRDTCGDDALIVGKCLDYATYQACPRSCNQCAPFYRWS